MTFSGTCRAVAWNYPEAFHSWNRIPHLYILTHIYIVLKKQTSYSGRVQAPLGGYCPNYKPPRVKQCHLVYIVETLHVYQTPDSMISGLSAVHRGRGNTLKSLTSRMKHIKRLVSTSLRNSELPICWLRAHQIGSREHS